MGIIHNKFVDKGTRRQLPRWRQVPLHIAYVMLLPLCGCQGMYVHNADRAEVAAVAKKNIDSIDVASIVKTEDDNLVKILAEEIKSIDARSKLVATLSTIQLATSDSRVADH